MSLAEPEKPPSSRRAIRPLRINAALLAIALAPLIFSLCTNLVTGGSFTAALQERNWWVFLFLVASGAIYLVANYQEAAERQRKVPPDKRGEDFARALPPYDRVARRALERAESGRQSEDRQERAAAPAAAPETVEGLVEDLFRKPAGGFRPGAYKAAWRLAALLASSNARAALQRLELTKTQLRQPRLEWLVRPGEGVTRSNDPLNVVQGRIGYLLRDGGLEYLPSSSQLAVDPYIAGALIAVRQGKAAYHSRCLVNPHRDDADIIRELYCARGSKADAGGASSPDHLNRMAYQDLGKLIRQDLPHTNPELAARQAELISHVMRHFLDDDLSAILFDALSPRNQVRLAVAMLTASQWMSPGDWQYWARTGHDHLYSPKLEAASDLSFAAAGILAIGVVVLGCWQLVSWAGYGWSWYFGSAHLLIALPGWLKAFSLVVAIALCVIWLSRVFVLGIAVAVAAAIGLVMSILASPIVRLHSWVASWETASTAVVCALISVGLLGWLGIFYSDRRSAEEPVQLGGFAKGRLSRMSPRSRFRPDHEGGHNDWCAVREP